MSRRTSTLQAVSMQSTDRKKKKKKKKNFDSVRIVDGVVQVSDVVAGLEWVGLNHKLPAVVTMSLGVKVRCGTSIQSVLAITPDMHDCSDA